MRPLIAPGLFAQAQAGDPAALVQVLTQLRPHIRRSVRLQCQHGTAIDDVVQEALIILYRKIGTVKALLALGGWLATAVVRLCMLAEMRLLRRHEDPAVATHAWPRVDEWPDYALGIDLARALESLPAPYRTIILMRDMQEMTIKELAAELGLTVEATKSRLYRARALTREYLTTEPRSERQ